MVGKHKTPGREAGVKQLFILGHDEVNGLVFPAKTRREREQHPRAQGCHGDAISPGCSAFWEAGDTLGPAKCQQSGCEGAFYWWDFTRRA